MADPLDLTVAVCTWNRADLLAQTLSHLLRVRVPAGLRWELVVVDNNSSDHTPRVLADAAGGLPLRAVREPHQGHTHARNRALLEARGAWVLWTDDDVRPDPGWLEGFAAAAGRHPDAAALGGPVRPWFPQPPDPDLAAVFAPLAGGFCGVDHGPAERRLGPGEYVFGANMAYRSAATAGLRFDPRIGRRAGGQGAGDDIEFLDRVRPRGAVWWAPGMSLEHYVLPERMTVDYARRFVRDTAVGPELPADPSPRLFGAPRWLVRQAAGAWVRAAVNRRPGRRRQRLAALLELWDAQARIAAFRRGRP